MKAKTILAAGLAAAVLTSCGAPAPLDAPSLVVEYERTGAIECDYTALREFCAEAAAASTTDSENSLVSPLSAYIALAMAREGADGTTRAEFDEVLGCDAADIYMLCRYLTELEGTTLTLANSVWLDETITPETEYLSIASSYYRAETFKVKMPTAANAINSWASEKTNGLIKKIAKNEDLDGALFVLMNALYMDAQWQNKFDRDHTRKREFNNADGSVSTIDFMYEESSYRVIDGDNFEGVVLPYRDGCLEFVAIMATDDASTTELAGRVLDAGSFASLASGAESTEAKLYLPKFELDYTLELSETVKSLGITDAFELSADFTNLADEQLMLDGIRQSVTLRVDEDGTEAAAIVLIKGAGSAAPPDDPRVLDFCKPFVFAVVDRMSGAILFSGEHNAA